MENSTTIPQLPTYTLKPLPPLLPWIPDFHLSLLLPVLAYWWISLIFWFIDKKDYFSQYRLHTPAEFKQRNRVSVGEVLRAVVSQQLIQAGLGLLISHVLGTGDTYGREEYDIALWTRRIHRARNVVLYVLMAMGIDGHLLVEKLDGFSISLSPLVPWLRTDLSITMVKSQLDQETKAGVPGWEILLAKAMLWVVEPAARFGIAILFSDAWQYFWHRAMHCNRWMYRKLISSFSLNLRAHSTIMKLMRFQSAPENDRH